MARSYRKPYVTDGYKGSFRKQWYKRFFNKVVRKTWEIPDGKAYRKFNDIYTLCDYRRYWPDAKYDEQWWKYYKK